MRADQVTQVRGYGGQLLRVKENPFRENPFDPSNRRISILVKNEGDAAPNLAPMPATQTQAVTSPRSGRPPNPQHTSGHS